MLYIRDKDNIQELIWGNRITEQKHFLTQILKNYVCFLCDIMKRDEVTGGQRKLRFEEIHNVYSTKYYQNDQGKDDEVGGPWGR